jgi:asparagine N-glycosylation enzyme membrane subunit Stt3
MVLTLIAVLSCSLRLACPPHLTFSFFTSNHYFFLQLIVLVVLFSVVQEAETEEK